MDLKPGTKLRSAVCETQIIVVRAPADPVDLRCGGSPVIPADEDPTEGATPAPELSEGTLIGKRYADEDLGLEVLCTRPGDGTLSIGTEPLAIKGAKPLPASD